MTNYTLPEEILYATEDRNELVALAETLYDEYQPVDETEVELFNRLLVASWLRKRYETVRGKLYDRKHALEPETPQWVTTVNSIRRFQHEVDAQKKQAAALRKMLRKYRAGELVTTEEPAYEYLPAA